MLTIIAPIYIALCLLVAFNGRSTRYGFSGMLFASIILTPIVVGIGFLLFGIDRQQKTQDLKAALDKPRA